MINLSADFQGCCIWGTTHQHGYWIFKWQRGNGNIPRYYFMTFLKMLRILCYTAVSHMCLTAQMWCILMYMYTSCLSYNYSVVVFYTGGSRGRLWGGWCSDWIRRWGEWEAAGGGGAAMCLVYEVVHCRHVCHRHCVCIVNLLFS